MAGPHLRRPPSGDPEVQVPQQIHIQGGLRAAQGCLNPMLAERNLGRNIGSSRQTLGQYLDHWLSACARQGCVPRLLLHDESPVSYYVVRSFHSVRIAATEQVVNGFKLVKRSDECFESVAQGGRNDVSVPGHWRRLAPSVVSIESAILLGCHEAEEMDMVEGGPPVPDTHRKG
jgi:hypothetical protein